MSLSSRHHKCSKYYTENCIFLGHGDISRDHMSNGKETTGTANFLPNLGSCLQGEVSPGRLSLMNSTRRLISHIVHRAGADDPSVLSKLLQLYLVTMLTKEQRELKD